MITRCIVGAWVFSLVMALAVGAEPTPEAAPDLSPEFRQRYEALAKDDASSRVALAEWCEQNGLTWDAAGLYAEVLWITPDNQQAYDRLVEITGAHPIPDDEQLRAQLREKYPDMKLHSTNHYVIVYSADENLTRNLAALLEKAHDTFFENFKRVDYKPIPLTHRLVCLYFATHEEYEQQGQRDGYNAGWAAGYYSPQSNWINYYDSREGPWMQQSRDRIKQYEDEAKKLGDEIREANRAGDRAKAADLQRRVQYNSRNLARARSWVNNYAQYGNVSTTIHEAVHQLAFNTGIQRRGARYPFWITEGIATNFETDDFINPFGPFQPSPRRQDDMLEMIAEDKLIPLERQIGIESVSGGGEDTTRLYAQSWALFNFFIRHRRDQLKTYLTSTAAVQEPIRDTKVFRQQFVDAFGEPAELEPYFNKYLQQLR